MEMTAAIDGSHPTSVAPTVPTAARSESINRGCRASSSATGVSSLWENDSSLWNLLHVPVSVDRPADRHQSAEASGDRHTLIVGHGRCRHAAKHERCALPDQTSNLIAVHVRNPFEDGAERHVWN